MTRSLLIIAGLLIAGCDAKYGVFRVADIDHFIDHKCINVSLQSVKEVASIEHAFMRGIPSMTSNMTDTYARHRYHYTVEHVNGFVSVLTNDNGTQVAQFSSAINLPPSQKDIDIIRPIMDKIEVAITSYCDVSNISSLVKETCRKVECI
jgi:hypothetical protein